MSASTMSITIVEDTMTKIGEDEIRVDRSREASTM